MKKRRKMNKNVINKMGKYFLSLIFLSILMVNQINSEVYSYKVDDNGNIDYLNENHYYPFEDLTNDESQNLDKIVEYAKHYFESSSDNNIGQVSYDDLNKKLTLSDSNGRVVMVIPKGTKLNVNREGNFFVTGVPENVKIGTEIKETQTQVGYGGAEKTEFVDITKKTLVRFRGSEFDLKKDSRIVFDEINGVNKIRIIGEISFYQIDDSYGSDELYKTSLENIKDVIIDIDENNEIEYLEFVSVEGGDYFLEHKGKTYQISVNKNANVKIDFREKEIKLEGVNDFFVEGSDSRFYIDENLDVFRSDEYFNGKLSLRLNDDGEIKSVRFEGGVFYTGSGKYYAVDGPMTVIFDDKNYFDELKQSDENKNLVYIDDEKILMKGKVNVDNLNSKALFYRGKDDESYTEFNRKDDFFKVKSGDASFGDPVYEIIIKNGESFFHKKNDFKIGISFGFSSEYKGIVREGYINTGGLNDELRLVMFDKTSEKVLSFPMNLDTLSENYEVSLSELVTNDLSSKILQGQIRMNEKLLRKLENNNEKGSEKWYETKFNLLKAKTSLNSFKGEKVTVYIDDLVQSINEIEAINDKSYDEVLAKYYDYTGKLLNQKVNEFKTKSMTATITFTNKGVSAPDGSVEDMVFKYDVKIGSNGKVRAYYDDKTQQWKTIDKNSELPAHLRFLKDDASISQLENIEKYNTHSNIYSVTLPKDYEERIKLAYQARDYFRKADKLGSYEPVELESRLVFTMINLGDYIEAERLSQRIIDQYSKDDSYNNDYVRLAYAQKAQSLFLDKNYAQAKKVIDKALEIDESNQYVREIQKEFNDAHLNAISRLATSEDERMFNSLLAFSGDTKGSSGSQTFSDVMSIIGSPWTTAYKAVNFDTYIKDVEGQINRAKQIGLAAKYLKQMNDNGVDLKKYYKSSFFDKFLDVYRSTGKDDLISGDDIKSVFDDSRLKSAETLKRMQVFNEILEEKGYDSKNPVLQKRFDDTLKAMNLIYSATVNWFGDPTLNSLMTNDDFVNPGDRLGEDIKLNTAEYVSLFAADIILNPLNFVGAGFSAREASASLKGLNLGLTTGLKTTGEAWLGITSKELAKAYLKEILTDATVSSSLEGIAQLDPELARNIGLGLGILVGGGFAKGTIDSLTRKNLGVKIYGNPESFRKGHRLFYVRSESDLLKLQKELGGKIIPKKIGKATKNGREVNFVLDQESLKTMVNEKEVVIRVNSYRGKNQFELDFWNILDKQAHGIIGQEMIMKTIEGTKAPYVPLVGDIIRFKSSKDGKFYRGEIISNYRVKYFKDGKKHYEDIGSESYFPIQRKVPTTTPTEFIESIESPELEAGFYKIRGEIFHASLDRDLDSVSSKEISDLPDEIFSRILANYADKSRYTVIHTHPIGLKIDSFALPSEQDFAHFFFDVNYRNSIIAMRNKKTGEVTGYLFLRKTSTNKLTSSNKYMEFYKDKEVKRNSWPPVVRDVIRFRGFGSVSNADDVYAAMDYLGDKLGFTYRYVPNKKAGYVFDRENIMFVKSE